MTEEDFGKLNEQSKSLEQVIQFSESTGINVLDVIEDSSPLKAKTQKGANQELLGRFLEQIGRSHENALKTWEKVLPDMRTHHAYCAFQIGLDMAAEQFSGGKIKSSGPLGKLAARWGSLLAVTTGLDDDLELYNPETMAGGKPPIIQDIQDAIKKNGAMGAVIEEAFPKGKYRSNQSIQEIAQFLEVVSHKLEDPLKAFSNWAQEKSKEALGKDHPIPKAVKTATKWFEELPASGKAVLGVGLASLISSTLIGGIGAAILAGLTIEAIQEKAKSLPDPKEEERRRAALEKEFGRAFNPHQPFWKEKIEKELQKEGIEPYKPFPLQGKPDPNILIVGEHHDQRIENEEAYLELIPTLAKQGYKTLSLKRPYNEPIEPWEKWYQDTKDIPLRELGTELIIQNAGSAMLLPYCIARRTGMEVIFSDNSQNELDSKRELFLRSSYELNNSGKFDPKKVTSYWGGPNGFLQDQENRQRFCIERDKKQATYIRRAARKGPVLHIGEAEHNENLQHLLKTEKAECPISLKIAYRTHEKHKEENKTPSTLEYKIPAKECGIWAQETLLPKKPKPKLFKKKQQEPELVL